MAMRADHRAVLLELDVDAPATTTTTQRAAPVHPPAATSLLPTNGVNIDMSAFGPDTSAAGSHINCSRVLHAFQYTPPAGPYLPVAHQC